jgi:hypothetical protein
MFGMFESMIGSMMPIIVAMIITLGLTVFVFLKANTSNFLKFFLVPIAFAVAIFTPWCFFNMLGYSYPNNLPAEFVYVHHKTLVKGGKKENIEVWLVEGNGQRTRLHLIPYEKNTERQLEEAKARTQQGNRVKFGLKKNGKADGTANDSDEYPYSMSIKAPSDLLPPKGAVQ